MSSRPSPEFSLSNTPESTDTSTFEDTHILHLFDSSNDSSEPPQPTAGLRPQTTSTHPPSTPSYSTPTAPSIVISESPAPERGSICGRDRTLLARHTPGSSSRQPLPRLRVPYARPVNLQKAHLQPRSVPTTAMSSSSSSPASTSTAGASGSSSGSNPTYQLPYAPFPYPMPPKNNSSGGSGSGK